MTHSKGPEMPSNVNSGLDNKGYGTFEVPAGAYIGDVRRLAAKHALASNIEMRFTFNDKPHAVTVDEARQILSPTDIRERISFLEGRINEAKAALEEERSLGRFLYGDSFSDQSQDEENPSSPASSEPRGSKD